MFAELAGWIRDSQASGHPQVNEQTSLLFQVDEQVFSPPADIDDEVAGDFIDIRRHRNAKPGLPDDHLEQGLPD